MTQENTAENSTSDDTEQAAMIQSVIREISHIATLPEITLKIIKLVEDPDSTAKDLHNLITNDPALGARILKVVNSAFYGLPGQVGSINRAIVLLGLNAVKNIAIAASLAKLFKGGDICENFSAKDLWTHSISVAIASRMLSDKAHLGLPDEAFLAGLIHDLGIIVEMQARRNELGEVFAKLTAENNTKSYREIEQEILGATHEQFGAALCRSWKFPSSFAYVTGYHHRPMDLPYEKRTLTSIVHIADILAKKLELGFTGDVECDNFNPEILEELKITHDMIDEIIEALPEAIEETKMMMSGG